MVCPMVQWVKCWDLRKTKKGEVIHVLVHFYNVSVGQEKKVSGIARPVSWLQTHTS